MRSIPKSGQKYKHFKGTIYIIICIAKDSETQKDYVIYQEENSLDKIWSREVNIFLDRIERPEYSGWRFTEL